MTSMSDMFTVTVPISSCSVSRFNVYLTERQELVLQRLCRLNESLLRREEHFACM